HFLIAPGQRRTRERHSDLSPIPIQIEVGPERWPTLEQCNQARDWRVNDGLQSGAHALRPLKSPTPTKPSQSWIIRSGIDLVFWTHRLRSDGLYLDDFPRSPWSKRKSASRALSSQFTHSLSFNVDHK